MTSENVTLDVNASILKHINMIKSWIPQRAVIAIGEYAGEILKNFTNPKNSDVLALFVDKAKKEDARPKALASNELKIDEKANTHYWFNVQQHVMKDQAFSERLRSKTFEKLGSALIVSSVGEGMGSFLLPSAASQIGEKGVESVGLSILPSQVQPPDAFFNALWSMGTCAQRGITQVLVERDELENYIGVDRKGTVLKGESVFSYLLELMLTKEFLVQEICELSDSFNVHHYSVLAATGASLKIHGSLENILNVASFMPLSNFDLSTATVLYVLVRMPTQLEGRITRRSIESTVNKWFKERASLKAVIVSEPIYVNDGSDRLDIAMFVGGFDLSKRIVALDRQVKDIVSYAVKNSFIEEKEWQELIKTLT